MHFLKEKKILTNYLNVQSRKSSNFKYLSFYENQTSTFYKVTDRKSHKTASVYTVGYLG